MRSKTTQSVIALKPNLFVPWARAHGFGWLPPIKWGMGSGLGLYLIMKMCEVYGWTIKEAGRRGGGVRFIMTLPKVNVDEGKKG